MYTTTNFYFSVEFRHDAFSRLLSLLITLLYDITYSIISDVWSEYTRFNTGLKFIIRKCYILRYFNKLKPENNLIYNKNYFKNNSLKNYSKDVLA